jgi:hypothetical protein
MDPATGGKPPPENVESAKVIVVAGKDKGGTTSELVLTPGTSATTYEGTSPPSYITALRVEFADLTVVASVDSQCDLR